MLLCTVFPRKSLKGGFNQRIDPCTPSFSFTPSLIMLITGSPIHVDVHLIQVRLRVTISLGCVSAALQVFKLTHVIQNFSTKSFGRSLRDVPGRVGRSSAPASQFQPEIPTAFYKRPAFVVGWSTHQSCSDFVGYSLILDRYYIIPAT
jgi:hypothetical protein